METSAGRSGKEVEEVEVPTNILQGDDERESCFDETKGIIYEVVTFEASWKDRNDLTHLLDNYGIPSYVLLRLMGEQERACSVPKDHYMPLYAQYLIAGLRFPTSKLLVMLLKEYGLGLT